MAFAKRLAVVIAGYLIAAAAATAAMICASWLRAGLPASEAASIADSLLWLTVLAGTYVATAAALPSLIAIVPAELAGWRLLRIYVLVGIAVALVTHNAGIGERIFGPSEYGFPSDMQDIIIGGGLVGGVVYWAIAGRTAGRARIRGSTGLPGGPEKLASGVEAGVEAGSPATTCADRKNEAA